MEYLLNLIANNANFGILTAFLLGALVAIDPCHLLASIAVIAYFGKEAHRTKKTLFRGIFYALGRILIYAAAAAIIYYGVISAEFLKPYSEWGEKIIGPILIIVGVIISGLIGREANHEHNTPEACDHCGEHCHEDAGFTKKVKDRFLSKGYWGAFLLGILLSLALCPYIATIFFGALIPLTFESHTGLLLPIAFAIGAGLPVIFFSFIAAFGSKKINSLFEATEKLEKILRIIAAIAFIAAGIFYLVA